MTEALQPPVTDDRPVLDPTTTAVIVVDMQNDFCLQDGAFGRLGRDVSSLTRPVDPSVDFLADMRARRVPIIFTRILWEGGVSPALQPGRFPAKRSRGRASSAPVLVPDSWGGDVVDALAPAPGDLVIDKSGYSAFEGTALETELRARGIRTVLVTGVVTYACVLATAFSAYDRGFNVVLLTDLVGSWFDHLGRDTAEIVDLLLGYALVSSDLVWADAP